MNTTNKNPISPLSDLENRTDVAWGSYIDACEKARRDRESIDAIVYAARHTWSELNYQLIQAQSANDQAQTPTP
jgi:hypothetical protein